jgi:3-methyladenine DNA glycosylase/8-oxoguanine DNA glycosylase
VVDGPYDFDQSTLFVPFGLYDPTCRRGPGVLWRAGHAPAGAVTLCVRRTATGVEASAWGPGAAWAVERAGALTGLDDPGGFAPTGALASLARRRAGLRLPRSPFVFDGLVEYVLQQRVTFRDAARAHRRLVSAHAPPSPGPPGLRLPLTPLEWLRIPDHELRAAGIDAQRGATLRAASRAARRLDEAFEQPLERARTRLAAVRGCGPWTVEMAMGFVLGDPDAVPTGDLHLPHEVARALAGEPRGDDRRMLELLEPYRGHRFRVLRLLLAAGRVRLGRASPRA